MNRFLMVCLILLMTGCSLHRLETGVTERGVRFALHAPKASRVAVVGGFNRWDREKDLLTGPDGNGYWTTTIPLSPGRYEYLFLADGNTWLRDPSAPSVDDGMGGANSVIVVDLSR